MYVRFIAPERDVCARTRRGLFGPAYETRDRFTPRDAPWQVHEIDRILVWFDRHLEAPDRVAVQDFRAKGRRNGVCWFRDAATDHVSQARYLAFLLDEMGVPVDELRARKPGTILWQDAHQVVALPERLH
jgi:hypothetical protein